MKKIFVAAVFSGILLVATAFVQNVYAQQQNASTKSSSDDRIDYQLRLRLADDPDVKGGALVVSVKDGTVTIKGRVDSDRGKAKATKLAKKVKGVKDVDNQLEVGPPK